MKKIYKLKEWYSVDDAARRLTETLGEPISTEDALQFAVEGHLPLSWYVRGRPARMVAPISLIYKPSDIILSNTEKAGKNHKGLAYTYATSLTLYPQSKEVVRLEGPYELEIEMMGWVKDWVLSLITKTGGNFVCMEGFLVRDPDENHWQILEQFPKKHGRDQEDYFPSGELPEPSELGFQKTDIEIFEARLNGADASKPLHTKERETALKLIIGMAVEGYKYDRKAVRSPIPEEIAGDLAKLGIPLDGDTVRKWLREGAGILSDFSDDKREEKEVFKTSSSRR